MPEPVPNFEFHPVCLAFSAYAPEAFRVRLEDYRENPTRAGDTAVLLAEDDDGAWKIADGRHHYLICRELGYECEFLRFTGSRSELVARVKALNANRRHDTESQLAAALAKLYEWEHGGDRGNQHTGGKASRDALPTQAEVADAAGISRSTVQRAAKVAKKAPELLPAVRDGKLDAKTAAKVADLPPAERAKVVAAPDVKKAADAATAKPRPESKDKPGRRKAADPPPPEPPAPSPDAGPADDAEITEPGWYTHPPEHVAGEVRELVKHVRAVRLAVSSLRESPYRPVVDRASPPDPAFKWDHDGEEHREGVVLTHNVVIRTSSCPAVDGLTRFLVTLENEVLKLTAPPREAAPWE